MASTDRNNVITDALIALNDDTDDDEDDNGMIPVASVFENDDDDDNVEVEKYDESNEEYKDNGEDVDEDRDNEDADNDDGDDDEGDCVEVVGESSDDDDNDDNDVIITEKSTTGNGKTSNEFLSDFTSFLADY